MGGYPSNVAELTRVDDSPASPVMGSLAQLHEALSQLESRFDRLSEKVRPFTLELDVPSRGGRDSLQAGPPQPRRCDVHDAVFVATGRVDSLTERVQRLLGELQV